ncbi:galactokinase [Sediminibacterium magnilacihabitans]|jgi:galactokinase|nr:galactokinase [Sediminibacterium magnilacihabitans]
MSLMKERVTELFRAQFGEPAVIVRSPGRINLIGEHTDYNLGFVLPAAVDKAIYIAIGPRNDEAIHLYAGDLDESFTSSLHDLKPTAKQWPNYLLGVADQLEKNGHRLAGFNAVVIGDVPLGAGLSSSAAVECATIFAMNEMWLLKLDRLSMVKMAQKAEHEFAGVKCGIMDQFASMFGQTGKVIQLDCRSLEYTYIPFNMEGIRIILFDTGVKHSLASSAYNKRREECEAGVALIQQKFPEVKSLRDATIDMVETCLAGKEVAVYHRCKYMVEEIDRLQKACTRLEQGDMAGFGEYMFETHEGLSKLYEVSCKELDVLASLARDCKGVLGARMMGGGFGGCTINLVKEDQVDETIAFIAEQYAKIFEKWPQHYIVAIDNGTSLL